ncbi:class F sortase [Kribbella soli]|nr:class F sortase [Kribbella soli]
MTISALAVGVVLLLIGGYVQIRMNNSDEGRQQPAAGPSSATQRPGTTSVVPGRTPSPGSTSQQTLEPTTQPTTPQETPPAEVLSTARVRPGDPISLSVPSLGMSARVLSIRARGGSLIPPSNPRLVGWWSDGARPGATKGSAVITGHTVHTGGGAFDDLDRLRAGDRVSVRTRHGTIEYVVTAVAIYRKKALAKQAQQIFSQGVRGRLVLVTCEDWDGTGYLSNAVVIAVPKTR